MALGADLLHETEDHVGQRHAADGESIGIFAKKKKSQGRGSNECVEEREEVAENDAR